MTIKPGPRTSRLQQILVALLVLAVVTLALVISRGWMSEIVALLLLLMAVLMNAAAFGFWPGLGSALVALTVFNFLFVEPHFTLMAAQPEDVVVLTAFLLAAGLTGSLAGRMREEVNSARDRALVLEVLSSASEAFASAGREEDILAGVVRHVGLLSDGPVTVLSREKGQEFRPHAAGARAMGVDLQAAEQVMLRGRVEVAIAEGWTGSHLTFHPLPSGGGARHAIGHRPPGAPGQDAEYRDQAITSVMQQADAALERLELARNAGKERLESERQALRAALLSSLSHDLRTPLATILGSVSTLRDLRESLPSEAQEDLLSAISEEAERLARYVGKLLQMTRLMAGGSVTLHAVDPADCARAASTRAQRAFPHAEIIADFPDLPLVMAEAGLLEQVVFSLIENATRYAPGRIRITGRRVGDEIRLEVHDGGEGLPQGVSAWLAGPELIPGAEKGGLGLPICKGIAMLLGGRLEAVPAAIDAASDNVIALVLPVPAAVPGEPA